MATALNSDLPATRSHAVETGGAATESMGGVAVIVLTILALAGVLSAVLTPIAGIVFGAAFMVEGAAMAARHSAIMAEAADDRVQQLEFGGGLTVEIVAGLAAVVLGILSLIGVETAILIPVLVITGGAGLLFSAGAVQRLNDVRAGILGVNPAVRAAVRTAVSSAAAAQALAGIGAGTLGVLALCGVGNPTLLSTIGILVLGASITLSGAAISGRMLSLFRRA